jgi:thymidylate kinase
MTEANQFEGRGRLIVLYGPNNLGKSTQLDLLENDWKTIGRPYVRIKYPIYTSETGILINRVLREDKDGNRLKMGDEELQYWFAENRLQFQPTLLELLEQGDVLAEDYKGTGFAWGLTKGVSRELLDLFNTGLLDPDIAILLDGEKRFSSGIEKGHRHETAGEDIWEKNRRIHQELAAEFGWEVVNANESIEAVHENILATIAKKW